MIRTVLLALLLAVPVTAQANPDSVKLRNDCRLAAQVLRTGHPAPRFQWATAVIHRCGVHEAAPALVAALDRLRSSSDSAEVNQVWGQVQYLRDARVYRTAMQVARDKGASMVARMSALMWLQRIRAPRQLALKDEVTGGFDANGRVRGGCGRYSRLAGESPFVAGEPLPLDFEAEITALGQTIAADESQPLDVRTAARCAETLGWGR